MNVFSLGTRFAEYGVTGGLFLFAQVVLFAWLAPQWSEAAFAGFADAAHMRLDSLPAELKPTGVSVLAALSIVSLFATGLLLELLGSVGVMWEAYIFKRHLQRGKEWLGPFFEEHRLFVADDFGRMVNEFGDPMGKEELVNTLRLFQFWKRSVWEVASKDLKRGFSRIGLLASFARLQSILLSHLLVKLDRPKLETLLDEYRLCRVSRSVGTGLFLLYIEAFLILGLAIINVDEAAISRMPLAAIVMLLVLLASLFIITRPYARFSLSLFSLVFLLRGSQQNAPADPGGQNPLSPDQGMHVTRRRPVTFTS